MWNEPQIAFALLENASRYAIVLLDRHGKVSNINRGATRILGFQPDDLIGSTIDQFFTPEDRFAGVPKQEVRTAIADGQAEDERWHIRKDGTRFWATGVLTCIRTPEGEVQGFAKMFRDGTTRKETEDELIRINFRLAQFAHTTSHDLKEPLRTIAMHLQLIAHLLGDSVDGKMKESLEFVVNSAKRMQKLVDEALDSQLSLEGKGSQEEVDCSAIVDVSRSLLGALLEENQAMVTRDALPILRAPAWQIERLFRNIISNAVKHRSQHPPVVHIGAERKESHWVFCIRDNGKGIAKQDHQRIFGDYERGTESGAPGTGLGLAISQRIVQANGGTIWVESEPGKGSAFFFTLPYRP